MRIRLLLAAAGLTLAACSESSTAPRNLKPNGRSADIACRSGYHIATRDDGSATCEPDGFAATPAGTSSEP